MNTKGIRLEIKPWLYKLLIERQDMLKSQTGRKTSLADILLDYCLKGIKMFKTEKKMSKNVQSENDSVQDQGKNLQNKQKMFASKGKFVQNGDKTVQNSVQNKSQNVQNHFLDDQLKLLDYKEKQLNHREKRLNEREKLLLRKENVQNQKSVQFFVQMEELLEQKAEVLNNFVENALNKQDLKQNEAELERKDEAIKVLEDKLVNRDNDIAKVLNGIDKSEKNNKKGSGFSIEKALPYVAPIISIVGILFLNNKINKNMNLGKLEQEVIKILKEVNGSDKPDSKEVVKAGIKDSDNQKT